MFSTQIAKTATTAMTAAARTRTQGTALPTSAHLVVTGAFGGADLGRRGDTTPAPIAATFPGTPVWRPPTC